MGIDDLIKSGVNAAVIVSANDLKEFAETVVERTRKDIEKDVIARNTEIYYSADQVRTILNVDASTLWRWNKRDYLVPIKIGRSPRYKKSDIDRILGNSKG